MKTRAHTARARSLRKNANAPEQIAWKALRGLRRQGFPVRRQHPIGRFIVDFAIVKAKLVIEIDGGIHQLASVAEKDAIREKEITEQGWRVLRVPAASAMSGDYLLALVQKELERRAIKWHPVYHHDGATRKESIASSDPDLSPDAIGL